MTLYKRYIKRPLDLVIALLALIVLSPLIILITLVQLVIYKGRPFYLQRRPGKDQKIFKIVKFKTMYNHRDQHGQLLPDDQRLNPFGRFLRASSLDEILQFINILKGDMSLIGPRPLLIEYLPLYNDFQARRHLIKPGVTGWAQVKGRNSLDWKERFELDVWYAENVSLFLDLKILCMTLINIISARGISGEGTATMEKFKGNKQ